METKEILAVILAAFGIILVIGILSMITKKGAAGSEDSVPEITEVTSQEPVYLETDIWDMLREQNTTTATTEETTDVEGSDVTGDGSETLPEGAETGDVTGEGTVSAGTADGSETETTAVTEITETQLTYFMIIR